MNTIIIIGGESQEWKRKAERRLMCCTDKFVSCEHLSEYEITPKNRLKWFVNKIHKADAVLVNLDELTYDDVFELAAIEAMNITGNEYIPVVGFGKNRDYAFPFIEDVVFEHKNEMNDAVDFIITNII